jgi:hypothetical protein
LAGVASSRGDARVAFLEKPNCDSVPGSVRVFVEQVLERNDERVRHRPEAG